jgi:hypothetical protein
VKVVLLIAGGVVLLAVGIAVGKASEDGPSDGGTQTLVRTLTPLQLPPARVTVTVTTTP